MSLSEITTDPLIAGFKPVAEAISRACNDRTFPSQVFLKSDYAIIMLVCRSDKRID